MFFPTLGRKKELVDYVEIGWEIKCEGEYLTHKIMKMDYVKIGWEIKCEGEYLTHKIIKMAKGKMVDERVFKWMIVFLERATKSKKKKGLFLKLYSIILSTLLFQNPKKKSSNFS